MQISMWYFPTLRQLINTVMQAMSLDLLDIILTQEQFPNLFLWRSLKLTLSSAEGDGRSMKC